ncbi:MAG: helix-turn-helix transcriptional regulator [Deltaproteobacteria bacterium]|jgi:DNA-binding Xre family transcriptional regulator|nr:helix-turn-helix transcriptional regulator [Deltaproteobacteria bacterium]
MGDGDIERTFNPSRFDSEKAIFVKQIKRIMFYRTMTCKEMSNLTGLTSGTVSRILTNLTCSTPTMKKILHGLKVSMDDVLDFRFPWDNEKR